LCDSSPLSIHSSIQGTLATLSTLNSTDKASQFVPHSRASHDLSDLSDMAKQNMESLCVLNHNKDSTCPVTSRSLDPEISPNSLSSSQMPPFSETIVAVPIRSYTVRLSTVTRTVRSDTELYDTVLGVLNAVQYGTPCNQDYVSVTVPFHSYKDKKPLNAIILIIKTSIVY
jgi:hypothetical protein